MNESELDRAEHLIRGMYDEFVTAVAAGRSLTPAQVGEVAQGRVWMGGDAIDRGLCDSFGTLGDAIELARERAGVPAWRRVQLVEYPPRRLFEMPDLLPGIPSFFGLESWLGSLMSRGLKQVADLEPEGRAQAFPVLPGLDALETDYVQRIGESPGRPLLMVPTQLLPDGWKELD